MGGDRDAKGIDYGSDRRVFAMLTMGSAMADQTNGTGKSQSGIHRWVQRAGGFVWALRVSADVHQ